MCRLCWEPMAESELTEDYLCDQCAHPERHRWRWLVIAGYMFSWVVFWLVTGCNPTVQQPPEVRCTFREVPEVRRNSRLVQEPRVINGSVVADAALPWEVSLQYSDGWHYCTGELVAPRWVLAAGHCLPTQVGARVVAGKHDLRDPGGQRVAIERSLRHELYADWSEGNDLALLQLKEAITGIAPVKLASPLTPPLVGKAAIIAGWGRTCSTCPTSPRLLVADVRVLSRESCNAFYGGGITDTMLCALGLGKDAAPGDSGGFLGQYVDGQLYQIGVVSWGRPCKAADPGEDPNQECVGVYADVASQYAGIHACIDGS